MKKIFCLCLCLMFMLNKSYSQNFKGGLLLGLSTSQVSGDKLAGFNKAGVLIGAFTNTKINTQMRIQLEITYIQKGSRNPEMNENGLPHISLNYIEVPLLIKYQQNNGLEFETGIQWAQLISGYYSDLNGRLKNTNIIPFINNDFGVLLGLNYKIKENIILNTRLTNSIFPIGNEDYTINVYNSERKGKYNSIISFAIYYYL